MSTPGQQIPPTAAFDAALAEFQSELRPKDRPKFLNTTYKNLKSEVDGIQTRLMQQRRGKNLVRLKSFLEAMDHFGKVVEVFGNASLLVAFVWVSPVGLPRFSHTGHTTHAPFLFQNMGCSGSD